MQQSFSDPLAWLSTQDSGWRDKLKTLANATDQGVLPPQIVALIRLLLVVNVTHLNADAARQRLIEAHKAGVSRGEILAVLKLASALGIHSYASAAPEFRTVFAAAGITEPQSAPSPTPVTTAVRQSGGFNPAWETIAAWDAVWLEAFLDMGLAVWREGVLSAKNIELLCVAGDAAVTHLWSSGVRRHAETALKLGATPAELIAVLRLVSLQGLESLEFAGSLVEEVFGKVN